MKKPISAADSIKTLQKHRYSLTSIKRLLESREIYVSVAMLSRVINPDPDQQRNAGESIRAELQMLVLELIR